MKEVPSADHIIKDIEFEILLGLIPKEDLENAILSVKAQLNKLRSDVMENLKDSRLKEALNRVFQIQEMLLVLIQEMSTIIGALQLGMPQIVGLRESSKNVSSHSQSFYFPASDEDEGFSSGLLLDPAEIEKLSEPDFMRLDPEVRPSKLPVIGRLIWLVKSAFHHLVLFYVNRLGAQQAQVNRRYGEQILRLYQIAVEQREQIKAMADLINDLRNQIQSQEGT